MSAADLTTPDVPVTVVRAEDLLDEPVPSDRRPGPALPRRRKLAGLALTAVGLPLLTLLLDRARGDLSLESVILLFLLTVVVIALVGGVVMALLSAVIAAGVINYFFTEPLHTLNIARRDQTIALGVFIVVAAAVSGLVEYAARRARAASQAAAQADTLSSLARADLDEEQTLHEILKRAREVFNMESVALMAHTRETDSWEPVDRAGYPAPKEAPLRFDVPAGPGMRLVGRGPALFAEDQRVLHAFAAAVETAHAGRQLTEQAKQARTLAVVDRQRTALLAAVGHDLRTPLAGIKAGVSSLRQGEVDFSPAERGELLQTIEDSADRLDKVVSNLLDASRLQAGELTVKARPVALDEVVASALLSLPEANHRIEVDVPEDLPRVQADPGLLERVLANLIDNSLRHAGDSGPVQIKAIPGASSAKLLIVDHGPGVAKEDRERLFTPFQRLDDRHSTRGVGLGLWVARGFTEAMDGVLIADGSQGGGLTMRLRLPLATPTGEKPSEPSEGAE